MGFAKYFEDDYEIYLERTENHFQANNGLVPFAVKSEQIKTVTLPKKNATKHNATDILLKCKDCDEMFVLTLGEQLFYQKHDLCNPKRCKPCRAVRHVKNCVLRR